MKFDAKQDVTSPLKFKLDPNVNGGLALGVLDSVELVINDSKESTSDWEYKGLALPNLVFRFTQKKEKESDKDRKFVHAERVIVSTSLVGDPLPAKTLNSLYSSMWRRLKHIYDAYAAFAPNVREITQEEIDAVAIDETASAEQRAKQFTNFFRYFESIFNKGTDGKPIYKDSSSVGYLMTMKLVAEYGGKEYYTFPSFTNEGFIEKAVFDGSKLVTALRLRTDESVELGKNRKAPSGSDADLANTQNQGLTPELLALLNMGK